MIVVDASIIAAFIRKEPGWMELTKFLKLCTTLDLAFKEVLNAIWKDAWLRRTIDFDIAIKLRDILLSMAGVNIMVEREDKYISRAFEVALKTGLTVYDSLYIALAMEKGLPLATLDEKQGDAAKNLGLKTVIPGS